MIPGGRRGEVFPARQGSGDRLPPFAAKIHCPVWNHLGLFALGIAGGGCWRRYLLSKTLGQSLESLPSGQRAERYRQFAQDALKRAAEAAAPDQRAEYIAMAAGWHTMALEAEKSAIADGQIARKPRARTARQKEPH